MSECVVRMEMPEKCHRCDIRLRCSPFLTKAGQTKPMCEGCRIVCQLPEEHGRLVDVDAVFERARGRRENGDLMDVALEICNAPIIVPATERRANDGTD